MRASVNCRGPVKRHAHSASAQILISIIEKVFDFAVHTVY